MKEPYNSVADDITDMTNSDSFWQLTGVTCGSSAACIKAVLQSLNETRGAFSVKLDSRTDRSDPSRTLKYRVVLTSTVFGTDKEKSAAIKQRKQQIERLLNQAQIESSSLTWPSSVWHGGVQGEDLEISIDLEQPEILDKLSKLMNAHKAAICDHYKDADFIFLKPNGEVLDAQQAAGVIARRQSILDADSAKLAQIAQDLGITSHSANVRQTRQPTNDWRSMLDDDSTAPAKVNAR